MTKIREILEKAFEPYQYEDGACEFYNDDEIFDKLEKELRDLIEWNHVGNNMIQIGSKFYRLEGGKRNLQKDYEKFIEEKK